MSTATLTAQDQLTRYAAVAWRPAELIEVRCLPAMRDGDGAPVSFWVKAEDLPGKYERLEALNVQGMNVYAGILPRAKEGGKSDADCAGGFAVWQDFDGMDPRAAWKTATAAGLPAPSMVINSGHGAHLIWALAERTDPAAISALVGDLAARLGSDSSVRNPSRILRLPGFVNWKPPVADAVLMFADPDRRYAFDALRAAVPVPERQAPAPDAPQGTPARTGGNSKTRRTSWNARESISPQWNRRGKARGINAVFVWRRRSGATSRFPMRTPGRSCGPGTRSTVRPWTIRNCARFSARQENTRSTLRAKKPMLHREARRMRRARNRPAW